MLPTQNRLSVIPLYSILHQYKDAVERAGSFDTTAVTKALEGHSFTLLKDEQTWRSFDHQNVQTVYGVKGKPQAEVLKDKFKADYFEIISTMSGEEAAFKIKGTVDDLSHIAE